MRQPLVQVQSWYYQQLLRTSTPCDANKHQAHRNRNVSACHCLAEGVHARHWQLGSGEAHWFTRYSIQYSYQCLPPLQHVHNFLRQHDLLRLWGSFAYLGRFVDVCFAPGHGYGCRLHARNGHRVVGELAETFVRYRLRTSMFTQTNPPGSTRGADLYPQGPTAMPVEGLRGFKRSQFLLLINGRICFLYINNNFLERKKGFFCSQPDDIG